MQINNDIHKLNWYKSIFIHGKWYLVSSLITKGIGILLLPVYTRYLLPEEYGILNGLNSIARLLPIFISLYLDSAFGRFFHEKKYNHNELKKLFSTIYTFVLSFGSFCIIFTIISSNFWLKSFFTVDVWPYAFLAFIPPLFLQIGMLGLVFLRQSLLARETTFLEIITTIITVIVTLPLLIIFDLGVIARLWGGVFSALFLFV
ncbi:lipopolysaccharide biosynthesis protein, partial [Spirochaetota bacterium]